MYHDCCVVCIVFVASCAMVHRHVHPHTLMHTVKYIFYSYSVISFQARDTLSAENAELHAQLEEVKVKIHALQQHLDVIRGHTIGFILEQMNTLHIETKESQL